MDSVSGLLNIAKPSGVSSFWIVKLIKRQLAVKKVGHCGTLDPLAEGVLLVVFGAATKKQNALMHQDKVYTATILLGHTTDTGDVTGKETSVSAVPADAQARIPEVLARFTGTISQIPPMFSALKYGGRKLYELAREGKTVVRQARTVTIHRIELLSYVEPRLELRVCCSSGTYVRTLAEDIGAALGCGGTIEKLRRDAVGDYQLTDAISTDDVRRWTKEALLEKAVSLEALSA